jgi:hypothetical protein
VYTSIVALVNEYRGQSFVKSFRRYVVPTLATFTSWRALYLHKRNKAQERAHPCAPSARPLAVVPPGEAAWAPEEQHAAKRLVFECWKLTVQAFAALVVGAMANRPQRLRHDRFSLEQYEDT